MLTFKIAHLGENILCRIRKITCYVIFESFLILIGSCLIFITTEKQECFFFILKTMGQRSTDFRVYRINFVIYCILKPTKQNQLWPNNHLENGQIQPGTLVLEPILPSLLFLPWSIYCNDLCLSYHSWRFLKFALKNIRSIFLKGCFNPLSLIHVSLYTFR